MTQPLAPTTQPTVIPPREDVRSVTPGLDALLARLDTFKGRVPLDQLEQELRELDLSQDDLSLFRSFREDCYCRNVIQRTDAYEALLLCWGPGQASRIHDHEGSSCCFRVLEGTVSEQRFRRAANGTGVVPTELVQEEAGATCASEDADIHQVCNHESGCLVTLHIYSPPLRQMRTYEPA